MDFLPLGTELPRLVAELTEATGSLARSVGGECVLASLRPLISMMEIYPDFVVLERGVGDPAAPFLLDAYITRRPTE